MKFRMKPIIALLLLAVSVALSVAGFCLLPETVVTQLSFGGKETTMPKIAALLVPFLLGAGGALAVLLERDPEKSGVRGFFVSGVGIVIAVVTLLVNLAG